MRRRILIFVLAAITVLALGGGLTYAAMGTTPSGLARPTWTLTRMTLDGQVQPLSATHHATLRFLAGQGQVAGSGGCNSFGGSYTLLGNGLRFGALRSTLLACDGADEAMAQESQYFQALSRVTDYQLTGGTLTLTGDGGGTALTFQAG